ncbi:MlaA family lipoprotein [Psychrosphaera aestuarii]|uniref:MlaA family lipoprotein n=1 Tax=Psychrosphaera aestuarii TaxID=1266052 RepID=UPI001B32AB15|nr:VacJ family lipoprotein [Psychrosphaera aestuarii]
MSTSLKGFFIAALLALTTACAQQPTNTQAQQDAQSTVNESPKIAAVPVDAQIEDAPLTASIPTYADERDPLESINRDLWHFNWEILDKYLLRPLAVGYTSLPQGAQTSVRSFVTNLEEPGYALNSLLQGKLKKTGVATGRFLINSTVGLLGFFDVANHMGLVQHKEDFGQTLAVTANVGDGPFLMLPGYGPTTVRDGVGDFVDGQIFPMYLIDWPWNLVKTGIKAVYTRADLIQQEQMINNSTDSYIFVKEAYFQNVNYKIYDGNPPIKEEFQLDDALLDEID